MLLVFLSLKKPQNKFNFFNFNSASQGNTHSNLSSNYWTEEMSTFSGLPAIDLEPLPSLFPFSPCGASYKTERPSHDMTDVLLSLKRAVLKSSPDPQQMHCQSQNYGSPQASLSYTVHPHQMILSPNHQHPSQGAPTYHQGGYYESQCIPHSSSLYPSMSVNVSMNMTMHGYGSDGNLPGQCSQLQWTPQTPNSSVNLLYPPLLSPGSYPNGATYSFTADFRPPPGSSQQMESMMEHDIKHSPTSPQSQYYHQANMAYSPQKSPAYNQVDFVVFIFFF